MGKETEAGGQIRLDGEAEMVTDSMMATVENARRYEVVLEGANTARLLARLVTERGSACLGRPTQGIGERLSALRLRGGRYEARAVRARE